MSWGIGCNDGIPAIYSSVPHAMCWIDRVMTCMPEASMDIQEDPVQERNDDDELVSVNGLRSGECRRWKGKMGQDNCRMFYVDE